MATDTTVLSLAKKVRNSTANTSRAYFNKGSRENKHSHSELELTNRVSTLTPPIYYEYKL